MGPSFSTARCDGPSSPDGTIDRAWLWSLGSLEKPPHSSQREASIPCPLEESDTQMLSAGTTVKGQ